jgi:integrase
MPDDLSQWFASHRAEQNAEKLRAPDGKEWLNNDLVFATALGPRPMDPPPGNIVDPANSRRQLADICVTAGLAEEQFVEVEGKAKRKVVGSIRPNELRHSCASLLSDEGVSNEQIADLLGHTTTRMVDQTYRHRLRPVVDVAATATWATETN